MPSVLDTMNLLNEAAGRYPKAVSFLAGRPPDEFVDPASVQGWINTYIHSRGSSTAERIRLGQYSDTNGIVRDVVATFLAAEGLPGASASNCMIVNGAQEGMLVALLGLCPPGKVALAADPTYVGFAGAAEILRVPVETLRDDDQFVERLITRLRRGRGEIGCIYLVPDYANPTGRTLTREERLAIVDVAQEYGVTIIEDTAYRRYRYEGDEIPTVYELADGHGVVLIESFAKSLLPGLRVGVLLAGQERASDHSLVGKWSSIKSYISVATSPLNQAALAGFLIESNYSLDTWMERRMNRLEQSRDELCDALRDAFTDQGPFSWTKPRGGFFCSLTLDRKFTLDDSIRCAHESDVLVMPMTLFSLMGRCSEMVRLAFSNVDTRSIAPAVKRFRDWLRTSESVCPAK